MHSDKQEPLPVPTVTTAPAPRSTRKNLKRAFLTGVAALLPTALTVVIFVWIFLFVYNYIAGPINTVIIWIIDLIDPDGWSKAEAIFYNKALVEDGPKQGLIDFSFVGFIVAVVAIFLVGFLLLTFFGRRLYNHVDRVLTKAPAVKMIYPHLKQLTEFILSDEKVAFRRVVMIPYPRYGLYSLGFLTGQSFQALRDKTGEDLLSVFIPSSPTPFTGYVVAVRREEILEVDITVDEALRFTVSGGVLVPPTKMTPEQALVQPPLPEAGRPTTED